MSSSMPIFWIQLLVFVAALATVEGLLLLVFSGRSAARRAAMQRLRRRTVRSEDGAADSADSILRREQETHALARAARSVLRGASLEQLLYRSGTSLTVTRLAVFSAVLAAAGLAFGTGWRSLGTGVLMGVSGALLPLLYIARAARVRLRLFEEQLPDALDLLTRALRAGISLEFGFRSAGEELPEPVGPEFGQVAHEVSLGLPLRTALLHLGERVPCRDLPFLTTAVLIQRETGGNLAEILDNLSKVVRGRQQFALKVRSLLAQMKLTANLLAVVPFVFAGLISVASPGYLSPLLETPVGRNFLYAAVGMIGLGWLLCRRMGVVRL